MGLSEYNESQRLPTMTCSRPGMTQNLWCPDTPAGLKQLTELGR
jgi:hypothetical protein